MVKISKSKHVTKKGVVKRNPERKSFSEMTSSALQGRIDANNTVAYMCQSTNKKRALDKLHENQVIALELQRRGL